MLGPVSDSVPSNSLSYAPGPIVRRIFLKQQLYTLFGSPPLVYLMMLISGLNQEETRSVSWTVVPPLAVVLGFFSATSLQ